MRQNITKILKLGVAFVVLCMLCALSLLFSCRDMSPDSVGGDPSSGALRLQFTLPSLAGFSSLAGGSTLATEPGLPLECELRRIQLVLFSVNGNTTKFYQYLSLDADNPVPEDGSASWDPYNGILTLFGESFNYYEFDLYAMANGEGTELKDLRTKDQVSKALAEHHGSISTPLPMSCVARLEGRGSCVVKLELVRAVAKIRLSVRLDETFRKNFPNYVFAEISSPNTPAEFQVINAPHLSYVYQQISKESGVDLVQLPADALATPTIPTHMGPVSKEDAAGRYRSSFITSVRNEVASWAINNDVGKQWDAEIKDNPSCNTYPNTTTKTWRVPVEDDYRALLKLKLEDMVFSSVDPSVKISSFGIKDNYKVIFAMTGLRFLTDGTWGFKNADTRFWSSTIDPKNTEYFWTLELHQTNGTFVGWGPEAMGFSMRCVKYIDEII